jgi:hypothetical protein
MVGLPCTVSQCAKLHVAGWTWAVFKRVYFYDFYSVSPEYFGYTLECIHSAHRAAHLHSAHQQSSIQCSQSVAVATLCTLSLAPQNVQISACSHCRSPQCCPVPVTVSQTALSVRPCRFIKAHSHIPCRSHFVPMPFC